MIATIGGTVMRDATTAITPVPTIPSICEKHGIEKSKGRTWRFSLLLICCVVSEAR
jgi:hypothetical protein